MTEQELANVIWDIKEIIRNSYDDSEVEDVILPFTLLRRLDCVLEDKYDEILEQLNKVEEGKRKYKLLSLMKKNSLTFFNMSGLSLKKLLNSPDQIGDSFKTYIEVMPFAPDASMDRSKDKVGCEFPFTRLFYKYRPLRSSEEILAELASLDNTLNEELSHLKEN